MHASRILPKGHAKHLLIMMLAFGILTGQWAVLQISQRTSNAYLTTTGALKLPVPIRLHARPIADVPVTVVERIVLKTPVQETVKEIFALARVKVLIVVHFARVKVAQAAALATVVVINALVTVVQNVALVLTAVLVAMAIIVRRTALELTAVRTVLGTIAEMNTASVVWIPVKRVINIQIHITV